VLLIGMCGGGLDKLVVVDSTRVIGFHSFQARQPDIVPPFVMKVDKTALILSSAQQQLSGGRSSGRKTMSSYGYSSSHYKEKLAGVPFASQGVLSQNQQTAGTKVSATALSDREYALIGTAGNKAAILNEEMQSRLKSVENDRRMQLSKSISQSSVRVGEDSRSRKSKSASPAPSSSAIDLGTPISTIRIASGDTSSSTPMPLRIERRERIDEHLSCNLFAMLPESKLLFSCAHWDNSFKVTAVDSGRLVQSVSHHREVVTCLALASDFGRHWLVTGSKDCIVIVWDLNPERESDPIDSAPLHILYGHDDCVNCLAVNAELDLVVSGSDDGTIIIHTLRDGSYLRSILIGISQSMYAKAVTAKGVDTLGGGSSSQNNRKPPSSPRVGSPRHGADPQIYKRRVHLVVVTCEGYIVTYSGDGNLLSTHTMNGRYVKMVDAKERLHAMCVSDDGKTVLTGGERCLVVVRWVNNLTLANNGPRKDLDAVIDGSHDHEHAPMDSPIRSLFLTNQERHLIVGLESGHIRVLAQVGYFILCEHFECQ
jgi:WD40 repeat protein